LTQFAILICLKNFLDSTYLVLTWSEQYLTNRFQFVPINNTYSYLIPVASGVPQGSILGPLPFILYMNDLPDTIHLSKTFLIADDTKCFKHSHQMINNYFNRTWTTYLLGVLHPVYLSTLPIALISRLIVKLWLHRTSEAHPSKPCTITKT